MALAAVGGRPEPVGAAIDRDGARGHRTITPRSSVSEVSPPHEVIEMVFVPVVGRALAAGRALSVWFFTGFVACGDGSAGPIDCPSGAAPFERVDESGLERWCETSAGLVHGPYESLSLDGAPRVEGRFRSGQADGRWRWYGELEPVVVREGEYRAGLPHGLFVDWHAPGVPSSERTFAAGVPCGTWRELSPSGEVLSERELIGCDTVPEPTSPDPDLVAPRGDTGWDGETCPSGVVPEVDPDDPLARGCRVGGAWDGPYARWHDPGYSIKAIDGAFVGGLAHGRWRTWSSSGALSSDGHFEGGLEEGTWRFYRPDGSLEQRGELREGLRSGLWKGFHANGTPSHEGAYVDGERDGAWTFRDTAGFLIEAVTYRNGLREGVATEYHAGGAEACAGAYVADVKDGAWTCWHPDGTVAERQSWSAGRADGTWESFDGEGLPLSRGAYQDGVATGQWVFWETFTYFGDQVWRARREGPVVEGRAHGRFVGTWELPGEPKESELDYVDGQREGPWSQWWPSGGVAVLGRFLEGLPHGRWKVFYESGQLQIDQGLFQGIFDGDYREYYESGDPKAEGRYRMGARVGTWTYWDSAGEARIVACDDWGNCP